MIARIAAAGSIALAVTIGAAPAVSAAAPPGLSWGTPRLVDPIRGGLTTVSCVAVDLCRAGDRGVGVHRWDGTRWRDGATFPAATAGIYAMSCPSRTFCAATQRFGDKSYRPITRRGSTWDLSARVVEASGRQAVSCVSATFCLLVTDRGEYQRWNGSSWSAPAAVPGALTLHDVSCASATLCRAVDGGHRAYLYNGTTWAPGFVRDQAGYLTAISCPTDTFCVAVDEEGRAIRHTAAGWSAPQRIDSTGNPLNAVDCTGPDFCVAVDAGGYATEWAGAAWTTVRQIQDRSRPTDVSCSSAGYCAVVSEQGFAVRLVNDTWQPGEVVAPAVGGPTAVSCASSTMCLALDASAARTRFTGTGWTIPDRVIYGSPFAFTAVSCYRTDECTAVNENGASQFVSPDGEFGAPHVAVTRGDRLTGVSCTSTTFCIAVSEAGSAATYDGFNWTVEPVVAAKIGLTDVSCVPGLCVAVTGFGQVVLRRGDTWSAPSQPDGASVYSVSCASTTFCMATTVDNRALRYDGSAWAVSSTQPVPHGDASCATATLCAAVGSHSAAVWNGATWTSAEPIVGAPDAALSGVSCVTTLCAAVDRSGLAVVAS